MRVIIMPYAAMIPRRKPDNTLRCCCQNAAISWPAARR